MTQRETITATLERVFFRKPENGWGIFGFDVGKAKGVIPWTPEAGQVLKLDGTWARDSFSGGMLFDFKAAYLSLPENPRALLAYAASITTGIGPAKETAIWEAHGAGWQDVTDLRLPGINEATRFAWRDTLRRIEEERIQSDTYAFLLGKGCSMNMATAAGERWKESTVGAVQGDCYALAKLPHYGFAAVDAAIRKNFGIADQDPRRIDAAILYVLGSNTDGSTLMMHDALLDGLAAIVPDVARLYDGALQRLRAAEEIGLVETGAGPGYALAEDLDNEAVIAGYFEGGE